MALLEWSPRFSTGVKEMDSQHRKLVDLLNELHAAMLRGDAREVLEPILNDLLQYTISHFSAEEGLLRRHGYPELPVQQREHEKLTAEVKRFQSEFKAGKVAMSINLLQFLRDWLQTHILQTDKRYGVYMNGKGLY